MRHRVGGYKLKRDKDQRKMLLRNLVTAVVERDRIVTTITKAKAIQPLVENMVTLAKKDSLASRRQAAAYLTTPDSVKRLFDEVGSKFGQRAGGYTRIVRVGPRKGDGAEMAIIEFVGTALVKRAAERAKRREERLQALREGKETGEE
ncbi:MAG: 50S ribosomal protein L17 [Bryobacterales bacterium]|nr:50S ribosomal protein L17 [Bryobacterales bacterium]